MIGRPDSRTPNLRQNFPKKNPDARREETNAETFVQVAFIKPLAARMLQCTFSPTLTAPHACRLKDRGAVSPSLPFFHLAHAGET
jgi:hypothetical protein